VIGGVRKIAVKRRRPAQNVNVVLKSVERRNVKIESR
jgi:hypothetical protein